MRLLDTMVIIGALNARDRYHRKASKYLEMLAKDNDVLLPLSTLMEFDLLMKTRNYADEERRSTWVELAPKISSQRILSHTAATFVRASELQKEGMGYFDSLITALAQELNSSVVTYDKQIAKHVET
ncbi:MAG: type II toxin-antitoxin system VapC family toxin, partial [Nitrososphaerales archaeon]